MSIPIFGNFREVGMGLYWHRIIELADVFGAHKLTDEVLFVLVLTPIVGTQQ